MQKDYETVSEAIADLKKRGYSLDFSVLAEKECLVCNIIDGALSPDQFKIDEFHRFEGMSDPGDEMIVYAISSATLGIKGSLASAFGTYADERTFKVVERLQKS